MTAPRIVVVVGPTAAGKSALALELAARCGGEVVSADSQQVYRGMDIGTGKLSLGERASVVHHLIDVVAPDDEMTAARFVALADAAIADCAARAVPVIVCGGTGLYVRALLLGLFAGPAADPKLRAQLTADVEAHGGIALQNRLRDVDPESADRIDANDHKRLIRALEVYLTTGVPMSVHQRSHDHRTQPLRYPTKFIGLAPPREQLYTRIDQRVISMMKGGWVEEVEGLRAAGYRPPLRSQQAIGYAELHAVLDGQLALERATELAQRNSRHYARRQISWYRPQAQIEWAEHPGAVDVAGATSFLLGS